MAMKNYAKQLNAQIEEVVAEVRDFISKNNSSQFYKLDSKSIGK